MATPFAAIETSVNTSAVKALANATLTWGVSSTADGIYRSPSSALLGDLVQGSEPTFTGLTSEVGAIAYNTPVAIGATSYTVVRNAPDGAGVTALTLQQAS